MALIRYPNLAEFSNPLGEVARARREMERLFSELLGRSPISVGSGVFPALNISEDADKFYVEAELPGIKPEDLEISVVGSTLTLSGERKINGAEGVCYHRRERRAGKFHKAITLPADINAEAVHAECNNGVLKLVLPKAEHVKPKKIQVKVE